MRIIITYILLFTTSTVFTQTHKVKYKKLNGEHSKGKVLMCPDYKSKFPCYKETCRKVGEWEYYYDNGKIERLEHYKKIKDCDSLEIPHGIWQYFNKEGTLDKEEEYREGKLWRTDVADIYRDSLLIGKIVIRKGLKDTIFTSQIFDKSSLVKNDDFSYYYGSPLIQYSDGQQGIEKQIPFWTTPNDNTPDYYNQYRRLIKIPNNFNHGYRETYNYAGIILYHDPTKDYSEYITGELNHRLDSAKNYCIKISIRLSQNSGFLINQFGVYLSSQIPNLPNTTDKQSIVPQISYSSYLDNRHGWKVYCANYIAQGNEKFISIGRFSSLSETSIHKINPLNFSEGELNQSAYYLFDKIELFEDSLKCNCISKQNEYDKKQRLDFELIGPNDTLIYNNNKVFVLNNIYFEFDKSDLLPESHVELEKLFDFLIKNSENITIIGHTDNYGTDSYNDNLSFSRANAVVEWLINKGLDKNRLNCKGYGARYPIVENDSPENRAINRRVEFTISKE
jgi:outer membrane protein OmpA-like peptidoglycan-associated protein